MKCAVINFVTEEKLITVSNDHISKGNCKNDNKS